MTVSIEQYRAAIGSFCIFLNGPVIKFPGVFRILCPSVSFSLKIFSGCSHISLLILTLLIISMDVHVNPGPTKVGICHANVRSLVSDRSKLDDLKYIADANTIDVITLSETWLNNSVPDCVLTLPGFQPILRRDRQGGGGGGVAIYCRDSLAVTPRPDLDDPDLQDVSMLWVQIHIDNRSILVGTYYRPPGQLASKRDAFIDSLNRSVTQAMELNPSVLIILGDFNDRCQTWDSPHSESELGLRLYNLVAHNGFKQIIDVPTRINDITRSLLDLIIVDSEQMIADSGTLPPVGTSDHSVVFCHINLEVSSSSSYKRRIWDFNHANFDGLNAALNMVPFDQVYELYDDVDAITEHWMSLLRSSILDFVPNRSVRIRSKDKPWVTPELRRLLRKRYRLWRRFRRTGNPVHYQIYKKVRNAVVSLNRKNIKQFVNNIDLNMGACVDSKKWWSNIKVLLSNKGHQSIPPILHEGHIITTDLEKAEIFNHYFTVQCTLPAAAATTSLPIFSHKTHTRLASLSVTHEEVKAVLRSLSNNKATGPDGIGNFILRSTAASISNPLCKLFNYSLHKGHFPSPWKVANVSPIFKKKDNKNPQNYRPISLLPSISKVFEKLVYDKLYNYLCLNNLLNSKNSGFRHGDSTINQLVSISDKLYRALDNRQEARMVFLDASKAFDKVWHKGLLFKLKQLGLQGTVIDWLSSYLDKRRQRVVINGAHSSWAFLEAGVPQGSILGPLLFLVYVNDITEGIRSDINLFADDTSLLEVINDPVISADVLNSDLNRLQQWASQWLVTFNASKTEIITFSAKVIKPFHPQLFLAGTPLVEVSHHTHLGLTFSNDLNWTTHIKSVVSKASQRVAIMKRLKYTLSRSTLERLYITLVRPILEYGSVIFDACTQADAQLMETVQYEAARICTGAIWNTNRNSLLSEMGWDLLETRRKISKLVLLFKMKNDLAPSYLSNILVSTVSDMHRYPLRNAHHFRPPRVNTSRYKRSFLPSTINLWNQLPMNIILQPDLLQFKRAVTFHLLNTKSPPFWRIGERSLSIFHTRLRLGLSGLNAHLFSHGLSESSSCACGYRMEDPTHFFFFCPQYAAHRPGLLSALDQSIQQIDTVLNPQMLTTRSKLVLLLSGSPHLSYNSNVALFNGVQTFIHKTRRFY